MNAHAWRRSEPPPTRLSLVYDNDLPAQRLVRAPRSVRTVAAAISMLFPVLAVLLLVVPWQQSATGSGQVIAWAPANRQQRVESPLKGRLVRWDVQEGERVAKGDVLAVLADNDPSYLERLRAQLQAAERQQAFAQDQIASYEAKLAAATAGRDLLVAEYDAKVASLLQKRVGDLAEASASATNATRLRTLYAEGIASSRKRELADMYADKATSAVQARDAQISATRRARDKAAADVDAKIASTRAELEAARGKAESASQKVLELQAKVSRQTTQEVLAPRDGVVLAVHGGPGGGQVKPGDLLVTLVPDTTDRAVEMWVDGNDMPLIERGGKVRLLFEGWPALQVAGLPGGSTGTFGGEVSWVDPAGDDKGRFRVVVVPDPSEAPWPSAQRLRQGVRAKGFVLLGQVRLGYELWRQINGFPVLPDLDKRSKPDLPTNKKPRAPSELR